MTKTINNSLPKPINKARFLDEFSKKFSRDSRYSISALPNLSDLVGKIESDPSIQDIRWAAYMLATVLWETTSPNTTTRAALNKKGQQLYDKKGRPIVIKERKWQFTMAPVDEVGHGKGRRYQDPVKVKILENGSARITEQDGDQFTITPKGLIGKISKTASMGVKPGISLSKIYENDDGVENVYYGRGFVQLTWWSNYAQAGIDIGRGLDLLVNPELVKDSAVAYAIMSLGMTTGKSFANGQKLSLYLSGSRADHIGARRIINGQDRSREIAEIAAKFEEILRNYPSNQPN